MSTSAYTNTKYDAAGYQLFRPTYPDSLYEHLSSYIGCTKPALAVDLGCGTGQATKALASKVSKVYGVDISEAMIKQAKEQPDLPSNVDYLVGNDTTLLDTFAPHSVDLLTVAEAFHYMSFPGFLDSVHRILKPNGVLAVWSYYMPAIILNESDTKSGYTQAGDMISRLNFETLSPYWEKRQHNLDDMYASIKFPPNQFKDVERQVNDNDKLRPGQPFELVRNDMKYRDVINLVRTWSSYHNWKRAHPEDPDIVDITDEKIKQATGLQEDDAVTVKWNTVYIFARAI